ncbi:MAG: dethiobiotin synthase [Betaproteobacteria bacterium]|nr:dethiobiotin synthase [Betaproteobacteria bacterium]
MTRGFFIVGTDTEIGKTFTLCALLWLLRQRGFNVAPMKPVAAGAVDMDGLLMNEDVAALLSVSDDTLSLSDVNPYCFSAPLAPHIAAQFEDTEMDIEVIEASFERLAARHEMVLVEGAGGFLVPLSATHSMAEIPERLGLAMILVVGMRLGCINHALLTVEAIRARGLRLAGWIANSPANHMNAFAENLATLKSLIDAPLLGTIPFIPRNLAPTPLEAAQRAALHLGDAVEVLRFF